MKPVEYFDLYASAGLQAIPLYPGSKVPVGKGWNESWDAFWCRSYLLDNPRSNIGILLGKIVDVEGDTDEANQFLNETLKDYPHPMYRSAKSTHHLFINPDSNLTKFGFSGIEFRGYRHQSVLPPSIHENGQKYFWLKECKFPIPSMPEPLMEFYLKNKKEPKPFKGKKSEIKAGHIRTICKKCNKKVFLHRKRLFLEVKAFFELRQLWQCQSCRNVDLRPACRRIRKQIISLNANSCKNHQNHLFQNIFA